MMTITQPHNSATVLALTLACHQLAAAATYYVAAEDRRASDANPGTARRPFKTISAAMARVVPGDTVLVKNGTYRESVTWTNIYPYPPNAEVAAGKITQDGVRETPRMTLAAFPGHRPVIKGTEVVTNRFVPARVALRRRAASAETEAGVADWNKLIGADGTLETQATPAVGGDLDHTAAPFVGIYVCPWEHYSSLVFVDGKPLKQVGFQGSRERVWNGGTFRLVREWDGHDVSDMRPGTFFCDEAAKKLYVWLPDNGDPNRHLIEAGLRSKGLELYGTWTVRGFDVLQHVDRSFIGGCHAVVLTGKGCVIENCRILHSGFTGLIVQGTDGVIRNNEIAYHGVCGMSCSLHWRLRVEGNYFHDNTWAGGVRCGQHGNKCCWIKDSAFIGNRFENEAIGLWLDLNCNNMLVAENTFSNCVVGMFFEISRWGVIVNNTFRNCGLGIMTCSADALVAHNVVDGCGYGIFIENRHGENGAGAAYKQTHFDRVADNPNWVNDSCLMAERNNLVINNIIINALHAFIMIEPDSAHGANNYSDYNVFGWTLPVVAPFAEHIQFNTSWTNRLGRLGVWRRVRRNDEHSLVADAASHATWQAGWKGSLSGVFPYDEFSDRDLVPTLGFVDHARGDYRLRPNSPLRGRGISVPIELNSTAITSRTTEIASRPWARTLTTSKGDPKFKVMRLLCHNWGSENYRIQPLPQLRRLVDLDTAAPSNPGINFTWRRAGIYPQFRSSGPPETVPDDFWLVYPQNRLRDPQFDRKLGEAWESVRGRLKIFQGAAVAELAPADTGAEHLVAQKIGPIRPDTEYVLWGSMQSAATGPGHGVRSFLGLAAGPGLKPLARAEVVTAPGQQRHWNVYTAYYRAGRDAQADPALGQDLYVVLGAAITGESDRSQTNPVARARWDNFFLLTGEEPVTPSDGERAAAEAVAPFPLATTVPASAWEPVNLAPVANRPLRGDDAFIGMPLIQVRPGPLTAAGVPFEILDGETNNDMACVALRSARIHNTRGKPLPSAVEVPVSGTARAVYFLHGAGWVTTHNPFAKYTLVYADGSTAELPIWSYGKEEEGPDVEERRRSAHVQDWWPVFPQFSSDHVRAIPVDAPDRADSSRRYLYALEWLNPHPEKPLRAIRMASDPDKEDSLLVLAITLLR